VKNRVPSGHNRVYPIPVDVVPVSDPTRKTSRPIQVPDPHIRGYG